MAFLTVYNLFKRQKYRQNIFGSLFLKLNQRWNKDEKCLGGFLQKPKTHSFGDLKWYFLEVKFQICKRKLHANFLTKILIFGPPGIFGPPRHAHRKLGLLKSYMPDLWLVDLPKKFPHSTLVYTSINELQPFRIRVGHPFFIKERSVLSVLYKRMFRSFRSL